MKKNKKTLVSILVVFIGLLIIGGTYAALTSQFNVENGNYSGKIECFKINYGISNDDDTENITGTLFPSSKIGEGLNGKVSLSIDNSCDVSGKGTLYMHISEGTSATLLQTVIEHCENPATLETMNSYSNIEDCTNNNGSWISTGTALKYAVYDNNTTTGTPLSVGYIKNSDIGDDIPVYTNFDVNYEEKNYYIYIWMDGYLMNEDYTNLPFGGYIHASVLQNE